MGWKGNEGWKTNVEEEDRKKNGYETRNNQYLVRLTDEEMAELEDLSAFAEKSKADILREGIKMFRQYGKYED